MLGKKIGMTQVYDESGNMIGVTVVEAGPCVVSQVKTVAKEGYDAIQITFGKKKCEIRVDNPADFKVGQEMKADAFKSGDMIEVSGTTVGKGFAGRIKRWHQHRGPMSHGSKFHRIPGSIGSGTTPGRVWKGKQMPGRMGNCQATNKGLTVIQVIPEKNLILLKGSVPGKRGNTVFIRKA
ncbi:MAG: 50S ribosomal protein L3 [Candidatus Margulisiibacteriota bacterium]|jgi:large subunit ribosomal protein L3